MSGHAQLGYQVTSGEGPFGSWSSVENCPPSTYFIDFSLQVEGQVSCVEHFVILELFACTVPAKGEEKDYNILYLTLNVFVIISYVGF
jgi:hypothetical protein